MQTKKVSLKRMEELQGVVNLIRAEAFRCRRLMCPSYTLLDVDDLVQEGVLCFFRVYALYQKEPEDRTPFPQYFYRALVNTYCGKLTLSFRHEDTETKADEEFFINRLVTNIHAGKVLDVVETCEGMSEEAIKYMMLCLNPPKEFQCQLKHKGNLAVIRRALGLKCHEERALRSEIVKSIRGIK